MKIICNLGGAKGKVTRHFFLKGLQKLAQYQTTKNFLKQLDLKKNQLDELFQFIE